MITEAELAVGRYWNRAWSLIDGCTPCSPGCERCWSAAGAYRFGNQLCRVLGGGGDPPRFEGHITYRNDRLGGRGTPLSTHKPTVWAVWNDLFHPDVPEAFQTDAFDAMERADRHTFLVLTKRPGRMAALFEYPGRLRPNIFLGVTVCNQREADRLLPVFAPCHRRGRLFLSLEPLLGPVEFGDDPGLLSGVIVGGETGPGARPMHPDWVRAIRDQCRAAGVPFFFKSWGEWFPANLGTRTNPACALYRDGRLLKIQADFDASGLEWARDIREQACGVGKTGILFVTRVGKKRAGRVLDGRTHDDLPWSAPNPQSAIRNPQ